MLLPLMGKKLPIDLTFMNGYLPSGASFTRASVKRAFNASGLLAEVAIDTPAFEYDPVSGAFLGLSMEPQRQNLQFPSTGSAATTMHQGERVTRGSGSAGSGIILGGTPGTVAKSTEGTGARAQRNWAVSAGTAYTVSLYLKKPEAFNGEYVAFGELAESGGLIVVNPYTGAVVQAGGALTGYSVEDKGAWWRLQITRSLSGTTWAIAFYPAFNTNGSSSEMSGIGTGYAHIIDGIQLEGGTTATSLIVTTTSAGTRAADFLNIPSVPWLRSYGSFLFDWSPVALVGSPVSLGGTSSNIWNLSSDSSGKLTSWNNSVALKTGNSTSAGTRRKEAFAYSATGRKVCLNGGVVASDADVPWPSAPQQIIIGNYNNNAQFMQGHVRQLQYYSYVFSDSEMQVRTTL